MVEWRHPLAGRAEILRDRSDYDVYVRLISWFLDDPSPLSPFSIHRFAAEGQRLGKQIGEWFGPSTAAGAIKSLANSFQPANLGVALAIDTTIYRSEVFSMAGASGTEGQWERPVLILVPVRLGLNNGVNPIYFKSIKHYFTLPQCVGIAGGRPSSSYYFVGTQNDNLFYIDPHHTKPSVKKVSIPDELRHQAEHKALRSSASRPGQLEDCFRSAYQPQELLSFHCDKVRKMSLTGLDPSMLVGLLCETRADWDDLCVRMKEFGSAKGAQPIIHIVQEMPAWMRNPSRTLSSTGRPADAIRDAKLSQLSESLSETLRQLNTSKEDADSVDYADSDDWDIEDSEGESNMGGQSIDRQSSAGVSVPSSSLPKEYTRVERPKDRNSADEEWQEMPQSARLACADVAGSPASLFFDTETEAVVVPSTAKTLSFPSETLSFTPEGDEESGTALRQTFRDSKEDADDWQGVTVESQRHRQTSNDSGGTQRAGSTS